jgi:hypothetical protein
MKKAIMSIAAFVVFVTASFVTSTIQAAESSPRIADIQMDTILMDDGTVWLKRLWAASGYEKVNVGAAKIHSADRSSSLDYDNALTSNGELISWNNESFPTVDKTQSGIKHLTDSYYLKHDGTVWSYNGEQRKDLQNISLLESAFNSIAYVTNSGEIHHSYLKYVVDQVPDASSIVSLEILSKNSLAYMDKTGKVVAVNLLDFDFSVEDVRFKPYVVTTDAVHISYADEDKLLVTRKDGTVWETDTYHNNYKLLKQADGIKNASKASIYKGSLHIQSDDGEKNLSYYRGNQQWLVQHKDGNWVIYAVPLGGKGLDATPIKPPAVSGLSFTASNAKPSVGNTIQFKIVQSYTNGYKETLSGKDIVLSIDKPHLLKAQKDGSYKVLGIGDVTATVTVGGISKKVTLASSLGSNLTGAIYANETVMLPVKSVFQSLGGSVSYTKTSNSYDITLGSKSIILKVGQKKATVDGKEVALDQAVREEKGVAVFPATFLTKVTGAVAKWDSKLKQLKVSVGSGTMIIESSDTPKVKKKEAQGALANYIGKSYWVNQYSNWERFIKLTITDIVPVGGENFEIVFAKTDGKTIKSEVTSRDFVTKILSDSYTFLSYDPYKKYNWPASTWDSIKASKISMGMNKTQVELSWGRPSSTSKVSSKTVNVEVWRYGYQYVVLTNGVVTQVYTL